MKKLIYISFLSLSGLFAFTAKAQSVSYSYVRNDPFDYKNFSASIDPLFIDVNGHNGYAFGWGLRAEYNMGKALLLNFDSRFGFGTNHYRKSNDNTSNYFNMEGGLGLVFINKAKNHNVPIILSQSTSGNTRTTVYIRGGVPAKIRRLVALRLGVIQYNNTLDYTKFTKNDADSFLTFSNGGTTMSYKQAKAADNAFFKYKTDTARTAPVSQVDQFGAIAMTTLYGGFQFRKIVNLLIDVDGYGYRSNVRYGDFYFDVLFAPVMMLRDFKVPVAGGGAVTYDVKYTKASHLGWRLGWFLRKPKEQGFSTKLEIGSRPGFKAPTTSTIPVNAKNLYCSFSFGLYIPLKIKPIYMGE